MGDADGVLQPNAEIVTVYVPELEQPQPDEGANGTAGIEIAVTYCAGLAVGEEQPLAIGGNATGLGQSGCRQGAIGDGFLPAAGIRTDHSGLQFQRPQLVDAGHGDIDNPVGQRDVPGRAQAE